MRQITMPFGISEDDADLHVAYWKRRFLNYIDRIIQDCEDRGLDNFQMVLYDVYNNLLIALMKDERNIINLLKQKTRPRYM
jgi:hypothetical protein